MSNLPKFHQLLVLPKMLTKKWQKKLQSVFKSDGFFFLLCLSIGWWLMSSTFASTPNQLQIAAKAWSDFGAHIPLIRSFSLGSNWPPEYPLFPGEPIKYHFLFYWLVGSLEKLGLNLGLALNSLSAFGFGLMLWMVFRTGKLIFKSSLAGVLAIWLTLMNSSLSFWVLADKAHLSWLEPGHWGKLFRLMSSAEHFASFGPWDGLPVSAFWTLNVFTNQRHFGLSLGLVWWLIWPLLKSWWPEKNSSLEAKLTPKISIGLGARVLILAIFPLLHQAGFLLAAILICLMLVGSLLQPKIRQAVNRYLWGSYLLGLALASLVLVQFVPASQSLPSMVFGFLATQKTWLGILDYWWWNLGLGLLIWLVGLIWPNPAKRLLWLVMPIFILVNTFQFSQDMINNHKLINFFAQVLAITLAGWIVLTLKQILSWRKQLTDQISWLVGLKILGVCLLVAPFLTLSLINWSLAGLTDLYPILNDREYILEDWRAKPISVWINDNLSPDATVLTTTYLYHPASLVGRKIFLDYGYFAWSLGYDDHNRRKLLSNLFGQFSQTKDWCSALQRQKISAVVVSPGKDELGNFVHKETGYMMTKLKPTIQTEDDYIVYRLADYCEQE